MVKRNKCSRCGEKVHDCNFQFKLGLCDGCITSKDLWEGKAKTENKQCPKCKGTNTIKSLNRDGQVLCNDCWDYFEDRRKLE